MNKNKHRISVLGGIGILLILVLTACGGSSTPAAPAVAPAPSSTDTSAAASPTSAPAAQGAVTISSSKLKKDNGSGQAGDEVTAFKSTDHAQYFEANVSDTLKPGSKAKWKFTAVDTTAGKDIAITEVSTDITLANMLTAKLTLDKDFPVGSYKADIFVDDVQIGTINYKVEQ